MNREHYMDVDTIRTSADADNGRRAEESQEVVRAISEGQVDAFVVSANDEPAVVTLSGADSPYRFLTERMAQGAVTVTSDGVILYANKPFARLVGIGIDALPGTPLAQLMLDTDVALLEALLLRARTHSVASEINFRRDLGSFPARLEAEKVFPGVDALSLLVTDLSEQRRHEAVVAAEGLGRSILEQAVDAVVVCDLGGNVIRASNSAHLLCGCNPLLQPFAEVFPLVADSVSFDLAAVQAGQVVRNASFVLPRDGEAVIVLVSAGPVIGSSGDTVATVITMTDISALKRTEAELVQADMRKDEMLAVVVHELRNPMSQISNIAELLHRSEGDRGSARLGLSLKRAVEHLTRLLEDLSDFNRIRLRKLNLVVQRLPLQSIVAAAVESCEALVAARRQQVEVQLPESPIVLLIDEVRLTQVIVNLLTNACKFTPAGGKIRVHAGVDRERMRATIAVTDSGIGISPAMLQRIFDPFEQGYGAEREGGLGIGLTLARRIVELHGGSLTAASSGEGKGSVFTVTLPLPA